MVSSETDTISWQTMAITDYVYGFMKQMYTPA